MYGLGQSMELNLCKIGIEKEPWPPSGSLPVTSIQVHPHLLFSTSGAKEWAGGVPIGEPPGLSV